MSNIEFADISFWQDAPDTPQGVDFEKMKTKASCVIIRVGQNLWVDPIFHTNWQGAKEAGMDRACYWFYDSRVSPDNQLEYLKKALGDDLGEGVIWLDLEDNYGGAYHGWEKWSAMLILMMEAFPDKKIGIYTAPYYWIENTQGEGIPQASLEWFSQFPLWIANYSVSEPMIPSPWKSYDIWQYGTPAVGLEWGVESKEIDMNIMDSEKYVEMFSNEYTEPEPPDGGNMTKYEGTTLYRVNVREGAGIEYDYARSALPLGAKIIADEKVLNGSDVWLHIVEQDGIPVDGWSASYYSGTQLIRIDSVTEPVDPPTEPPVEEFPSEITLTIGEESQIYDKRE